MLKTIVSSSCLELLVVILILTLAVSPAVPALTLVVTVVPLMDGVPTVTAPDTTVAVAVLMVSPVARTLVKLIENVSVSSGSFGS